MVVKRHYGRLAVGKEGFFPEDETTAKLGTLAWLTQFSEGEYIKSLPQSAERKRFLPLLPQDREKVQCAPPKKARPASEAGREER